MSEYYFTRDELYHHGIKGQKWGLRRFQNEDGSLTAAGREHYGYSQARADRAKSEALTAHKIANVYTNAMDRKAAKRQAQADKKTNPFTRYNAQLRADRAKEEAKQAHKIADAYTGAMDKKAEKRQAQADYYKTPEGQKELKVRQEKMKKAAIAGAAIVGTALVAYGAYKFYETNQGKKLNNLERNISNGKKMVDYYTKKLSAAETLNYKYHRESDIYERAFRKEGLPGLRSHYVDKANEYLDKARRATNSGLAANRALRDASSTLDENMKAHALTSLYDIKGRPLK